MTNDAFDNAKADKAILERLSAPHWHIGSNVPGYMPESDVFGLTGSVEDAAESVWEKAVRGFESDAEAHAMDCATCAIDADFWGAQCDAAPYLTGVGGTNTDARGSLDIYLERPDSPHNLGVHYWAQEIAPEERATMCGADCEE